MTDIVAFYASLATHQEDSYAGVAETFLVMLAMHVPQFSSPRTRVTRPPVLPFRTHHLATERMQHTRATQENTHGTAHAWDNPTNPMDFKQWEDTDIGNPTNIIQCNDTP